MATLKDATIILFDIGTRTEGFDESNSKTFCDQAKDCLGKIISRKIVTRKSDEVAVILIGSAHTENDLNSKYGGHNNISLLYPMDRVSWDLLRSIHGNIPKEHTSADWLDGLKVAIDYFETLNLQKCVKKILLFTTFSTGVNDEDIGTVIGNLRRMKIELIVISTNVIYDIDPMDFSERTKFRQTANKSTARANNERLITKIIELTTGNLHSLDQSIIELLYAEKNQSKRVACNCELTLGTKLSIKVAIYVYVRDEVVLDPYKARKIKAAVLDSQRSRTAPDSVVMDLLVNAEEEPSTSGTVRVYGILGQTSTMFSDRNLNGSSRDDQIELVSRECTNSASDVVMLSIGENGEPSASSVAQSLGGESPMNLATVTSEIVTGACYSKTEHYHNGKLLEPETVAEHVTKGYKYDGKLYDFVEPPYDNGGKGLRCIGFTDTGTIRTEHLKCETIRFIVPQKKSRTSVKRFSGILRVMQIRNWAIVARYTNSDRAMPELMALIPGEDSMLMYKLPFNNECYKLSFPRLKKDDEFTPTAEQYEFMDKLIDSMDLMGDGETPEYFRYLQDPRFQQECNSLVFAILHPNEDLPENYEDVEALTRAPKSLSTDDIEKMKSLFPLMPADEKENLSLGRANTSNGHRGDINVSTEPNSTNQHNGETSRIGTNKPHEDFLRLSMRGEPFNDLATQMQNILEDFVEGFMNPGADTYLRNCLSVYRSKAKRSAPLQYNRWIRSFRDLLKLHQRTELWEVIVQGNFGLISSIESEKSNVSFEESRLFYIKTEESNEKMHRLGFESFQHQFIPFLTSFS